jgi:hypothetical protein
VSRLSSSAVYDPPAALFCPGYHHFPVTFGFVGSSMSTDGQNVTLETGERAGRVDASTAVARVAICAGLTA